ncbi:hypothetical protein GCM10023107_09690 [Actinoplanes octamycinicus]|nr:hypothetical protein Aoc01nite_81430 [Actinoplanes octamycinicus]
MISRQAAAVAASNAPRTTVHPSRTNPSTSTRPILATAADRVDAFRGALKPAQVLPGGDC